MSRDDFGDMIEQQIPRLRRYARALVRHREQADDLVEECLDHAWRRAHQWDPAEDLRVWLFSIIHNLSANSARGFQPMSNSPAAGGHWHPRPLERGSTADLETVENGLAQLSEDHHAVLLLVCVEEMSYEQVAAVLGVPVGAVIARLHHAREHLRRWMNREQRPSLRRIK